MKYTISRLILLFLFLSISLSVTHAKDSAMIVFDASGSMWGQLNGKAKIEIARDVMGTLVKDWNEDIEMGLDDDGLTFTHKVRKPTLYPKQSRYYADTQYLPLLAYPPKGKTKADQLIQWLEDNKAYKKQ